MAPKKAREKTSSRASKAKPKGKHASKKSQSKGAKDQAERNTKSAPEDYRDMLCPAYIDIKHLSPFQKLYCGHAKILVDNYQEALQHLHEVESELEKFRPYVELMQPQLEKKKKRLTGKQSVNLGYLDID